MWTVVRIPAGNNTNLHYNFVVVIALVFYYGLIQIPDLIRLDFVYQIELIINYKYVPNMHLNGYHPSRFQVIKVTRFGKLTIKYIDRHMN